MEMASRASERVRMKTRRSRGATRRNLRAVNGAGGLEPPSRSLSASENGGDALARRLLALMQAPDYTPLTVSQLAEALGERGRGRHALRRRLDRFVQTGEVVLLSRSRYAPAEPGALVTGRLEVRRSGDGCVTPLAGGSGLFIRSSDMGTALPGDLVLARAEEAATGQRGRLKTGRIIRVLERGRRVIVGTLRHTGRFYYVVPLNPSYQQDFYVPEPRGAAVNDRVVMQFTNWEHRHVNPEGEIIEVLGPVENASLDTQAVMRHYGLSEAFPEEVIQAAEQAAARMDAPGEREDFRDRLVFTVDPATARDFDDALSLEEESGGRRVLGVHIADVAHFVELGGALDAEAAERGNSVYLPDRVLPMLPEHLSNGLCSLKPDQDRLAFSVFLTVDGQGRVLSARFAKTLIRSRLRLTYEEALKVIETPAGMRRGIEQVPADVAAKLREICVLAQQMRRRRIAQYALDLSLPECEVALGADGRIADIRPVVNDWSHQMIEECMVAANEAVDRELSRRGYALLHRLHEPPAPDRIEELAVALKELGFKVGPLSQRRVLAEFLRSVQEHPLGHYAQMEVLKRMKRAVYSAETAGHFGLAKRYYAHFTSPIRRYPDLVVHRILASALRREPSPYVLDELKRLAEHCSRTEQTAEEAERDILEIKKYRFLAQQLEDRKPLEYEAVIVSVTHFGLFVELPQLDVQGLVHVSALPGGYARYDAAARVLRAGTESYGHGARIKVHVAAVNFDKRRIDFAVSGATARRLPGGRRRSRR